LLRYFIVGSGTATQAYFCCFVWMLIENTQKRAFRYFFKVLQKQFIISLQLFKAAFVFCS